MEKKRVKWIVLSMLTVSIIIVGMIWIDDRNEKKRNEEIYQLLVEGDWVSVDNSVDSEVITFEENKEFSYYCSCGSPVGDSDGYNKFLINKNGNIRIYDYEYPAQHQVYKIESLDESILQILVKGELRKFVNMNNIDNVPDIYFGESEEEPEQLSPLEKAGTWLRSQKLCDCRICEIEIAYCEGYGKLVGVTEDTIEIFGIMDVDDNHDFDMTNAETQTIKVSSDVEIELIRESIFSYEPNCIWEYLTKEELKEMADNQEVMVTVDYWEGAVCDITILRPLEVEN